MVTEKSGRFVSRLTQNTLALVLAGGRGNRLGIFTNWRTKPAVPFSGKFRIIDFTLSNCLNSHIRRICLLTQYKSHSLLQHILQAWNRFNAESGEFLDIVPAQQWMDEQTWYKGTADAVYQSLDIIESYVPDYVLVLAGDHIYTMDYGEMLARHVASGADFTIACNVVTREEAKHFGVMQVDDTGRIIDFQEKPDDPKTIPGDPDKVLVSMGIYVFSREYLGAQLRSDAGNTSSSHDFGKDIIPFALKAGDHIQSYRFVNPYDGGAYWRDVGTVDAYYNANIELLSDEPPLNIYDPDWPVMTYQPQLPPAHFLGGSAKCDIDHSMVSGGCVIEQSNLSCSLLFSNVKVKQHSTLKGVLALPGCEIGAGSRLTRVILDNLCKIPEGTVIGEDPEEDRKRFDVTDQGIVVVNREMLGQGLRYIPGLGVETRDKLVNPVP